MGEEVGRLLEVMVDFLVKQLKPLLPEMTEEEIRADVLTLWDLNYLALHTDGEKVWWTVKPGLMDRADELKPACPRSSINPDLQSHLRRVLKSSDRHNQI